jgi:hypothetical protein
VYISRLVKTRDPYPGLFQLAVCFHFFSSLSSLFRLFLWSLPFLHLYFKLYACLYLVEVLSGLLTRRRPIVITHSVYNQVARCAATIPVQVGRTLSEVLH